MKYHLFYSIMLLTCLNTTYATENNGQVSLQGETLEHGKAASLRIHTGDYLYGGLSLNYINSDTVIQDGNRKTIYPLFLFMGLKYPSKITPFIEAAVDLPEAIIDEIFDNEENTIDLTDYYLSGGFDISLTDRFSISVYAKKYVFKYQETTWFTTSKVRTDSYGAGITLRF
ncbi:MAG: hypothetical protein OEY87_04110 [Gammaproteobacteria bacterium]|nr:hypothetical protein [Gammaproteobacteria bacterium]